jgi:indolepyruvate ferredoxin oxidoreductase alpha subunit
MVNQDLCNQCRICISTFGCPAYFYEDDGSVHIDEQQCNGCGNCVQVCPSHAIKVKKEEDA